MTQTAAEPVTLLERTRQLATLGEALTSVAQSSRGAVALVAGEAGVGKTQLLRQFCEDAGGAARVLWGTCDALATPRPLGPLLDLAEITGGELQEQVSAKAAPHDVAAALLRELVSSKPVVVVLEDVHWADEATLDVLRLVVRRIDGVRALVVVSFRDEQVGRTHPLRLLLGELPRNGRVTRIDLTSLSRESVAELAEAAAVDADELYARTGGNPFFVTEVLAAQAQGMPATIRDAVLARAARLSAPARWVLDAVAVVPQRTEVWLLEALDEIAAGSLQECLDSGMLEGDRDTVAFRHELARLAIEASLPPDRRVTLNRRAVAALADRPGAPELARLAHHAEAAGDGEAVLRFAQAAAEQAQSMGAHREAAAQYARVLRFADGLSPEERAGLLERFAAEGYLTDMRTACIDALAEAGAIHRSTGDVLRLSDTLMRRARALTCAGRGEEAAADSDAAIAILTASGSDQALTKALTEQSSAAMLADRLEEAIASGLRAVELADRVGDSESLVRALNNVGTSQLLSGDDAGLEKLERSIALAREPFPSRAGSGFVNIVAGLGRRREWRRAEPYIAEGVEFCREHGLEAWENCLLGGEAQSLLARGRWQEAAALAAKLLDATWADHASARLEPLCTLAIVRARRGDAERWPLLDEAHELAQRDGSLQYLAPVAAARAEAVWLEGRPEAIASETARALALAVELGEGHTATELASWRRRAGITDELPEGLAAGVFALEVAGDYRRAAETWRSLGLPYESALALAETDDEESLRQAHAELQALEARPAAAIVARRLRARGALNVPRGPRRRTRENPAGLTRRELQVLALLAEGLRTSEIAGRLVLSERTVDHHVSAILRKLGARSRGQAAAEAHRLGLIASSSC